MSRRFILDNDPISGRFSTFEYDPSTDMYILTQGQDVSRIIEANKVDYNTDRVRSSRQEDGFGQKVATIDLHTYMELRKKGIVQDRKAFKRWLNDPDNRAFRTAPGTV